MASRNYCLSLVVPLGDKAFGRYDYSTSPTLFVHVGPPEADTD